MKNKSLLIACASCLFFLALSLSPAVYAGARIDLVVDHGVDKEADAQARAAINAIIDFFHNTYGLGLERDIRIKLTCDKLNYQRSIQEWYGAGEAAAARQSEITGGLQSRGAIIINFGSIHNSHFQLFCLCHEIVHHFQSQESSDKYGSIRWMTEGVANVIAAHILATIGIKRAAYGKNLWLQNLKKAQSWPRLESLHTGAEWYAVMQARPRVTYETASLAVLTLVEWRGYGSLFNYFRALKNTSPEEAFYQAFGSRLTDFEKQFRPF
jgi:hypothetical protein